MMADIDGPSTSSSDNIIREGEHVVLDANGFKTLITVKRGRYTARTMPKECMLDNACAHLGGGCMGPLQVSSLSIVLGIMCSKAKVGKNHVSLDSIIGRQYGTQFELEQGARDISIKRHKSDRYHRPSSLCTLLPVGLCPGGSLAGHWQATGRPLLILLVACARGLFMLFLNSHCVMSWKIFAVQGCGMGSLEDCLTGQEQQ